MPLGPNPREPIDLWPPIHAARRALADDLSTLTDDDWRRATLCGEWDIEHVVAHLTAAASVGRWAWIRSIVTARFRPAVHNDRLLREHLGATPGETLARFEQVADSRVAPTGDTAAYLGEVLVHGQDIRHPLDLPNPTEVAEWTTVADFYIRRDFAVDSRTLTQGLRLVATDGPSAAGEGPQLAGPIEALVMTMAGRTAYLGQLTGPGLVELTRRLAERRR